MTSQEQDTPTVDIAKNMSQYASQISKNWFSTPYFAVMSVTVDLPVLPRSSRDVIF